jgi:hypothetical protein
MPKRGRNEPKAKGPHHHHQIQKLSAFQKSLSFGIQKGEKVVFQKWYIKRWISFRGSFV